MTRPIISIVTATYNRSNVLRFAIESVLRSEFADWELLVVGDACTDDTGAVVSSFGDSRVRFVNLAKNWGEQSGPNNEGARLARGEFIAYLNHDDFYFHDHLGTSLRWLEQTRADLVFSATAVAAPRTAEELARHDWRFRLYGVTPTGRYEPYIFAPASSWVLRRALIDAIGGWRPAARCLIESSQEFLFRAYRAGKSLRFTQSVGVLAVQSGARADVYQKREFHENEFYSVQLQRNPQLRERIVSGVALDLAGRASVPKLHFHLGRTLRKIMYRPALGFGVHPRAMRALLKGRSRGTMIEGLRKIRGLGPLPRRD